MSIIEKLIYAISPETGFNRARYRAAYQNLGFDAAVRGRRTASWMAGGESAEAEFGVHGYDLDTIIARSRDLVRNTPYAARAVAIMASSICGIGIVPRLKTEDTAVKRTVRDDWERFSDNCDPEGLQDFYGKTLQAIRCMIESGGALIRWLPRPLDEYEFPLQCQVLEPDYIDKRKNETGADGGYTIHGVEYDKTGRRTAYWLFDRHPGDVVFGRAALLSKRVSAEYIDPLFQPLRPGQVHGVPWMTPIILRAKDINDYDSNEVRRKKIETAIAMIVERNGGGVGGALGKTETQGNGRKKETVKPETIMYMQNNETVKFPNPSHVQGYGEFMGYQLHAMAAGIGVTYEQMTGDLAGTNYSSARVGRLEFCKLVDALQWLVVVPQLSRPAWRRFQAVRQVMHGDIGQGPAIYAMPEKQGVDPEKEQNAKKAAVRNGFTGLANVIAEQGEDPEEVLDGIAAMNKKLDELGLTLDTDPRKVVTAGSAQVQQQNQDSNGSNKND
jgi:lambda family phage portal protein